MRIDVDGRAAAAMYGYSDLNVFPAVPAKAATQSHARRSSVLKLLDARFRGQGKI
jgi:hypothetical protein